ncbi:hypothetical protein DM01DRAFT_323312 [Hesseltinella vesiculosa]|uniref:Uncharacterized protein n=1 Tax=Hesseltinella vesiculosa TaxID=101127 RepID=A0A1X2GC08_9FUNG|nr:hypothetical protein DM01DRAFT_323312 [Hesseltinella vesiculosa]
MAKVIQVSIDTRRDIDLEIQKVCEEFTADSVRSVAEPINSFLLKLSTKRSSDANASNDRLLIPSQQVAQVINQFKEAISERLPYVQSKLREYINDTKMEEILLQPIDASG